MSLFHEANQQALDEDGNPIPGATWNFYLAGTLTPTPVYSSNSLNTSLGAVVTADGAGRFDPIFLNDGISYRAILKDGTTTITDLDPVNGADGSMFLTPQQFGAVAAGGVSDQEALEDAFEQARTDYRTVDGAYPWSQPSNAVFLPMGDYTAEEVLALTPETPGGNVNVLLWAIPRTVTVTIPDGEYFLETNDLLANLYLFGINFIGGKGAYRHRYTGSNTIGMRWVEKCYFDSYTECAIASNASDDPYWRIRDCMFSGDPAENTRGIALGGLIDSAHIHGNTFIRNQYHIVLNDLRSGSFHVDQNDFISFANDHTLADIVIGPHEGVGGFGTNAGHAATFSGNKFGNENLNETAPRILLARLNPTGDGRENHPIDTTWLTGTDGKYYMVGLQFEKNNWGFNGNSNQPIIYSRVDYVQNIRWAGDNTINGGQPNYLVEFAAARSAQPNQRWDIDLSLYMQNAVSGFPFAIAVSNQPVGPIWDHTGGYTGRYLAQPHAPTVGNENTILFAEDDTDWTVFGSATKTAVTGPNASSATEFDAAAVDGTIMAFAAFDATGKTDQMAWLVVNLAEGATVPLTGLRMNLFNFADNIHAFNLFDIKLGADFRPYVFPVIIPTTATPAAWQVRLYPSDYSAGVRDKVRLGTFHLHTGAMPVIRPKATAITNPVDPATTQAGLISVLEILRTNNLLAR